MNFKILKISGKFKVLILSSLFLLPNFVLAQIEDIEETVGLRFAEAIGLPKGGTPHVIIVNLIDYFLSFIGIIAVIIFMLGGLKWMLSMGDEEKIAAAKRTLSSGFVGLIIVLLAYSIVAFIIRSAGDVLE